MSDNICVQKSEKADSAKNQVNSKKIIFSGMQPSGFPSLGNYLGAIKNWIPLQEEYNCLYCIVDMHAITIKQDPQKLRKKIRELLTLYIAAGLEPDKNILFIQSHVPAHAELAWILSCSTYMGELNRMTQYKEKSQIHAENINAGLFTYPVLMAADILLYGSHLVPVGEDQKQHIELCRDVATRFNNSYGEIFTIPEPYIAKSACRIMGLQNPEKKMSKSDNANNNNVVFLLDEPNVIINKIKRAITDSDNEVRYAKDKPGISNLLEIYCAVTKKSIANAEKEFLGVGYSTFKNAVGSAVVEELEPIQRRFKELSEDKAYIDQVIKSGADKANKMAAKIINKAKKKIGFLL